MYYTRNFKYYYAYKTTTKNVVIKNADKTLLKIYQRMRTICVCAVVVAAILQVMLLSYVVVVFVVEQRPCNAAFFTFSAPHLLFADNEVSLIYLFTVLFIAVACFYNSPRTRNGSEFLWCKKHNNSKSHCSIGGGIVAARHSLLLVFAFVFVFVFVLIFFYGQQIRKMRRQPFRGRQNSVTKRRQ